MEAFLQERNLDVIHAALPVVGVSLPVDYFGGLVAFLVEQDLWLKHPALLCRLLGMDRLRGLWDRSLLETLFGGSNDSWACLAIWGAIVEAEEGSRLPPPYWTRLLGRWLGSRETNVRYGALLLGRRLISQLGEAALELQVILTGLLSDPDPVVRHQVLRTFFTLATDENWHKICDLALDAIQRPRQQGEQHWGNLRVLAETARCVGERAQEEAPRQKYARRILQKLPIWTLREEYLSVLGPLRDQLRDLAGGADGVAHFLWMEKLMLEPKETIDEGNAAADGDDQEDGSRTEGEGTFHRDNHWRPDQPAAGGEKVHSDAEWIARRCALQAELEPQFVGDHEWHREQYEANPLETYAADRTCPPGTSDWTSSPTPPPVSPSPTGSPLPTLPIPVELMQDIFAGLTPRGLSRADSDN